MRRPVTQPVSHQPASQLVSQYIIKPVQLIKTCKKIDACTVLVIGMGCKWSESHHIWSKSGEYDESHFGAEDEDQHNDVLEARNRGNVLCKFMQIYERLHNNVPTHTIIYENMKP